MSTTRAVSDRRFAWITLCCVVISPPLCRAIEVTVGSTKVSIPPPPGHVLITSVMEPYSRFASHYVAPGNKQFAQFLSSEDAAKASAGSIPKAVRGFSVQVPNNIIDSNVSDAQFAAVKQVTKANLQELLRKVSAATPEMTRRVGEQLAAEPQIAVRKVQSAELVAFPPHYESSRCLTWSTQVRRVMQTDEGGTTDSDYAITSALVLVRDKILLLNVWGEPAGRDWTRAECTRWAQTIIIANQSERRSSTSVAGNGLFARVIGVALVVVIIGFLRRALRNKKTAERS